MKRIIIFLVAVIVVLVAIIAILLSIIRGRSYTEISANEDDRPFYISIIPSKTNSKLYLMELLPGINSMYVGSEELYAQSVWIQSTLNKCLARLETQRGLEPYTPQFFPYGLGGGIGEEVKFPRIPEPWFVPYQPPQNNSLTETDGIAFVRVAVSNQGKGMLKRSECTAKWIENFEERMKRLEENTAYGKDSILPEASKSAE